MKIRLKSKPMRILKDKYKIDKKVIFAERSFKRNLF